ncbi:MAG TPA: hypothetical protein PK644_06540, partial [bacterium]|nr:hypothetical protein [bacterium]
MNTGQLEKLSSALYRLQTQLNFAEKLLSLRPDPVGKMEVDLVRKKMTEEKPRLSEKNASEFVAGCEK